MKEIESGSELGSIKLQEELEDEALKIWLLPHSCFKPTTLDCGYTFSPLSHQRREENNSILTIKIDLFDIPCSGSLIHRRIILTSTTSILFIQSQFLPSLQQKTMFLISCLIKENNINFKILSSINLYLSITLIYSNFSCKSTISFQPQTPKRGWRHHSLAPNINFVSPLNDSRTSQATKKW